MDPSAFAYAKKIEIFVYQTLLCVLSVSCSRQVAERDVKFMCVSCKLRVTVADRCRQIYGKFGNLR